MRTQASFHCRGDAQGLMNAAKVVVHVEQRNHGDVIVQLLAERARQAREAPHVHPHVESLPFHETGRDVRLVRVADDFDALGAQTLRGAVALLSFRIVAINLHQLRVVDLISKRIRNGSQIHPDGRPWSTGFGSTICQLYPEGNPLHTPRPSGLRPN